MSQNGQFPTLNMGVTHMSASIRVIEGGCRVTILKCDILSEWLAGEASISSNPNAAPDSGH